MTNTEKSNSGSLRRRLLVQFHEDGILDLVIGLTAILLAGTLSFDEVVFIGMIGIPLVFYFPLKERITYKRLGFVRFKSKAGTERIFGLTTLIGLIPLLGLIALLIFSDGLSSDFMITLEANGPYYFAGLVGGVFAGIAYFMQNKRFAYYALLGVVGIISAKLLGAPVWIAVAVMGLTMATAGTYLLVKFTRQYPIAEDGE